jgi:hypothetical protein
MRHRVKPRAAYCTGCKRTYPDMNTMINHRRRERCGGRFLPLEDQLFLQQLRAARELQERHMREYLREIG